MTDYPCKKVLSLLVLGLSCLLAGLHAANQDKPNFIIIFTDDQGFADLGVQGVVDDIHTPHLDALAEAGARFTSGYITAPQCSPSRAGLMTGRYQQRYGIDSIADMPLPLEAVTIAERLDEAGYVTGMVGKWHLNPAFSSRQWIRQNQDAIIDDPDTEIGRNLKEEAWLPYAPGDRGFDEFYFNLPPWDAHHFYANYRADGSSLDPDGEYLDETTGDRMEDEARAALAFIERNHDKPFFLYFAYSGPHTQVYLPKEEFNKYPADMPERRRAALYMMETMDDGVGRMMDALRRHGIEEDTLIFFASDNGAPLKLTKEDSKLIPWDENPRMLIQHDKGGWDGSLNDPLNGEKGMLAEGGIRIPYFVTWKGHIPGGQVKHAPVTVLDFIPTMLAAAGLPVDPELDGKDLLPYLRGEVDEPPHEALYWRFWKQAAIRRGDWKLLYLGDDTKYLFNMADDPEEQNDLSETHPELAHELLLQLRDWTFELKPKGLPRNGIGRERGFYRHYFDHNKKGSSAIIVE